MRTIKYFIRGFTLIEMVIVMIIAGIVMVMASTLVRTGFTNYFTAVNATTLSTQATMVMTRISKELQQAVSFSAINSTNITFTTTSGSTISYNWTSPNLTRMGTSTAKTMSNQVTAFSLSYYQSNFTATSTTTAVQAITISMTLSNGNEIIPLINTVYLNN